MPPTNPLFPSQDEPAKPEDPGYLLPRSEKELQPRGVDAAVNLIREKLARIYAEEPDPLAEAREAEAVKPRSKHQQFMHQLSASGKSIAEVQTAWHNYYIGLPDSEKHEVWQEFYAASGSVQHPQQADQARQYRPGSLSAPPHTAPAPKQPAPSAGPVASQGVIVSSHAAPEDERTPQQIRSRIRHHVTAGGRLKAKHHFQSLGFGLAIGLTTLIIFLFSFFNEIVIAPFIQPGRAAGATPIIVDPSTVATTNTPEVIIPKINLEIPVDFSQTSTVEADIENALENGIVHYPSTVLPGQAGNAAFFGHSSNNIFNPGKYKFAFVLLHELVPGDTFYITYGGKAYVYKVFSTRIVDPNDIEVLNNVAGHNATATLITCDPPGTSLHRLIVVGDQISPDPAGNSTGTNTTSTSMNTSAELPGNGPSLLQRLWDSIF